MTDLAIIIAPDMRLKRRAEPVDAIDDGIRTLIAGMLDTMHHANGIGLAAPQVGVLKRVIVVDVSAPDQTPEPHGMVNPEIIWTSDDAVTGEEGCLSLPDHFADVTRPGRIRVRYLDGDGEAKEMEADGMLAKCIQHEIDHLNGVLFVDHLSALKRNIILRKLSKAKKMGAVAA